ncbi:extracellular solute-binding protein [Paenibacillus sp. S150]|uniref:extracellular solute-binding protein n=1 Tax=Paenibacillus sp. S150 TaxID=2749826 RepID=UPI001C585283|nr:extracellular solute-binding protein [Paenibacillus sp. S150]MBW4083383.1 extracellular solute-binding protein [Paenibacillus sp. S150]
MKRLRDLRVAGVLSLSMLLFLSACGGSGNGETAGTAATASPAAETGAEEEVYTYQWMNYNYPFEDGSYGQKLMEDTFGIKVQIIRMDEVEQINLKIATGEIPDLMVVTDPTVITEYAKSGALAEISEDFIKEHAPGYYEMLLKQEPNALTYGMVEGKNYAMPSTSSNVAPTSIAIRGDWLQNVGEAVPQTLEDLERVFVKFRENDPDQDGQKDTYAMSMPSDYPAMWFQSIFGAFGTNPFIWKQEEGKMQYGFTADGMSDALKLLNKWYEMELIDPEFITDKHRTQAQDDISYKFASGRIGYMDNLTFDDEQWDNDGQLNAKWVANNPEWQEYFADPANALSYTLKPFTELTDSGPQPVYVNIKPPVNSDGVSGSYQDNAVIKYLLFGKQLEDQPEKLAKLLEVLDTTLTDEELYVAIEYGPEGKAWEYDEAGQRVWVEGWTESSEYHPKGQIMGTGLYFDPFYSMNPAFSAAFGGARSVQRYELTKPVIADALPGYSNALKAPLPSASQYSELDTMLQEYIMKAILGEVDVDGTYEAMVQKWLDNGGSQLTREADDWYASLN